MRNLSEVLDRMIEKVPFGEHETLRENLVQHRYNSYYQPPESNYEWKKVAITLSREFGPYPPISGWQEKVYRIFVDRENPE